MTISGKVIATTVAAAEILIIASAFGGGYLYARGKFEPDAIKLKARVDSVTLALEASNQKVIETKKYTDSITSAYKTVIANIKPKVDTLWRHLEVAGAPVNIRPIVDSLKEEYSIQEESYKMIISAKDSLITDMTAAAQVKDSTITSLVAENTALQQQVTQLNNKLKNQSRVTKILGLIAAGGIAYAAIRR